MAKGTVKSQMEGGFPKPGLTDAPGKYGASPGPFSKPQDMGNGGIPTKFYDTTFTPAVPAPTQTAGLDSIKARPGTTQRPYGKTDT